MHSSMGASAPRKEGTMADLKDDVVPVAFTLPQTAAALGVPLRDVKNLVDDGILGTIGIGIRRIVPRDELMRFLRENLIRRA